MKKNRLLIIEVFIMDAFIIMIRNVLLFAVLAIPGYLLVKCGILKQEQSGTLSKILMYVGMPFLILKGTVNNLTLTGETLVQLLFVAGVGVLYTLVMFFVSKPLTVFEKEKKTNGMMRFCTVFSNNGFLGLPLAIAVFGGDSQVFVVLIILNIISNVLMFTLGSYLVSGDKNSISIKKAVLNPVLIAFIIGVVLNLLKLKDYVPELVTYSDHFNNIVTPISMTILGMKLADVKLSALFTSLKGYYVSLLKLVAFPAIIVALLFVFKPFIGNIINNDVIMGFFIAFAMPTAGLASTFADNFGGDTKNSVVFTLGTTLLSIFTIPTLYWLLTIFI